ncbi:MAG: ImmA/IrrE family metallo-endopeptidase [Peptostreptococcaceae bacterium]|nr:ImmA/IrrE family metallo-endopeptidase [Peptostreptococcaceae bacterium]
MEGINKVVLNPNEELNLVELTKSKRRLLDLGMGPIGEKIFSVFRDNNIQLLNFAIKTENTKGLVAFYLEKSSSVTGIQSYYIAINTLVPLDLQIFNACHEYYHHIDDNKNYLHIQRISEPDDELINSKANRFAAEFLLPTETLITLVKKQNRGSVDLDKWSNNALLRLIVQIQIDYQVPYKMIVKRLNEIGAIEQSLKYELLSINERDNESVYYKIGKTINEFVFVRLNRETNKHGVDMEALNTILQNYDEETITLDSTIRDLKIFDKKIEDFGYKINVNEDDIDEIAELFGADD